MPASQTAGTNVDFSAPVRHHVYWPRTPEEQTSREAFETVGEGVLDMILSPMRRSIPLTYTGRERSLGSLYPGACYRGHQNAAEESKQYPVEVVIQEYPRLTTFFEAEIVGPKYTFVTGKWDAQLESDERHWGQFPFFTDHCRNYLLPSPPSNLPSYSFQDNKFVFMRWKEHFLVPDHHIESVHGASYAGFYYIAYNKTDNTIEGYYYHRESRDYQKLFLKHVPQRAFASFEFR